MHAEVKSLQQTLGISYKDAAHRLFMAEVERLKVVDSASNRFRDLGHHIDSYIEMFDQSNRVDGVDDIDQNSTENGVQ